MAIKDEIDNLCVVGFIYLSIYKMGVHRILFIIQKWATPIHEATPMEPLSLKIHYSVGLLVDLYH
jgi:hypothetical protein